MQALLDTLAVVALATAAAGVVFGLGWPLLRGVRARSVGASIAVVLFCTVTSVVAGSLLAAWQMFLSPHDLRVALVILFVAATVSALAAWRMASGLREEAGWAEDFVARETQMGQGRQELIAFVSEDLREPVERLRALAREADTDEASARESRRRVATEADRLIGLLDDLAELSRPQRKGAAANSVMPSSKPTAAVNPSSAEALPGSART